MLIALHAINAIILLHRRSIRRYIINMITPYCVVDAADSGSTNCSVDAVDSGSTNCSVDAVGCWATGNQPSGHSLT